MRKMFLHIGLPKTGSTSLQFWAFAHRKALAQQGIFYPEPLMKADSPKHEELTDFFKRGDTERLDAFFKNLPHDKTIFVSVEGLSSHLIDIERSDERLEAFRAWITQFDVTLIAMTREPEGWLKSYHRQKITNRPTINPDLLFATTLKLEDFAQQPHIRDMLDTKGFIQRAAETYCARSTVTIPIETDWQSALCDTLDVSGMAETLRQAPKENIGMTDADTELLRQANATERWQARADLIRFFKGDPLNDLSDTDRRNLAELIACLNPCDTATAKRMRELQTLVGLPT